MRWGLAGVGEPDPAMVVVFFFVAAIVSYVVHGAQRDTTNQFEHADRGTEVSMAFLVIGELGGFVVLLAGFIAGQPLS